MRSRTLRHIIPLRLTLVGTSPQIWRQVHVDSDSSLDDLRGVLRSVFEVFDCAHHIFTDTLQSPTWSRSRRRWGDRWTMIDFRDPTIIDAATARVGSVFRGREPIYFAHSCSADWLLEIEPGVDEMALASEPAVRVVDGEGRAPFACARGPFEVEVLSAILDDPVHPHHHALSERVAYALGPWGSFLPDQPAIDRAGSDAGASADGRAQPHGVRPVLDSIVRDLPRLARAGLQSHLAATGLGLPIVTTNDEAAIATRDFRWLIEKACPSGIALTDGAVEPAFIAAGCEELGRHEEHVLRLVEAARRMRLVYRRNGRLLAKKDVVAAAESPTVLWGALAEALMNSHVVDPATRDIFLLAIADGSMASGDAWLDRAAEVAALVRGQRWDSRLYGGYRDAQPCGHRADAGCQSACDCPRVDGRTWHDVVAAAIRDAASESAREGAHTVASGTDVDDLREAGVLPEWIASGTDFGEDLGQTYDRARGAALSERVRIVTPTEFLSDAEGLIELLSFFGLARGRDDSWEVPPALREFARAALQVPADRRARAGWTAEHSWREGAWSGDRF